MTRIGELSSLAALLALLAACAAAPAPTAPPPTAPAAHGFHKDFSDAATFSKSFDDPERDAWQRPAELIEHLQIPEGKVIVDLGAGTGYFLSRLSAAAGPTGKVLALDVEPNMISFMRERMQKESLANVEPRQVAPDDPGLAAGSVSRVLIVNTWHHIDNRAAYAHKLALALEPAGEIWVVDFTLEAKHGPPAHHRLTPEQVVSELESGGLHAEVVAPESLIDQYLVRARLRAGSATTAPNGN
jgi:predicted methyltransferase